MIYFITFTDKSFIDAGERIVQQAKELNLFDSIELFGEQYLKEDSAFWIEHSEFIEYSSRGYGYWIWKPFVILKKMREIADGDILLYCDAGCELNWNRRTELKEIFAKPLVISCSVSGKPEKDWTKRDLFVEMETDLPEYADSIQYQATAICLKKTGIVMDFINEWWLWSSIHHFIDDSPSLLENYPSFQYHRHDQSIFSLLIKKRNISCDINIDKCVYLLRNNTSKRCIINNVLGFVFTRHVNSSTSNLFWIECYRKIRQYYPNCTIMIVDDHSNESFITPVPLTNCFIVQSEYWGRGEILAYYYYHKYRPFEKAVILHDSTFVNKYIIDFYNVENVRFLWSFIHNYDKPELEETYLSQLSHSEELIKFHKNLEEWDGCFGVQSVISFSFLDSIFQKYNLFCLMDSILSRNERYHFERIFAVICSYELREKDISMFGKIHSYSWGWGYTFEQYLNHKITGEIKHLPLVKVWCGR